MKIKYKELDKRLKKIRGFNYEKILKAKVVIDEFYIDNIQSINKKNIDERKRKLEYSSKTIDNVVYPALINIIYGVIIGGAFYLTSLYNSIINKFEIDVENKIYEFKLVNGTMTDSQNEVIIGIVKNTKNQIYFSQGKVLATLIIAAVLYLIWTKSMYKSRLKVMELNLYELQKLSKICE